MRAVLLIAGLAAFPVHADLYRWVDPQSGSVKYSSVAPSWYGNPGTPAVEVVGSARPRTAPAAPASSVAALEARWRAFLESFALRAGASEQSRGTYEALAAELDRLDPAGAARRRAEAARVMENLKR